MFNRRIDLRVDIGDDGVQLFFGELVIQHHLPQLGQRVLGLHFGDMLGRHVAEVRAEEVAQGLRDASASVQELVSEIVSLRDAVARTELRAPVEGVVHELSVSAPGSVIAAGATLAQIVPIERGLEIEVAVDPRNIDSVHEGQAAEVVLSTYDPRVVPRLPARVGHVPPGAAQNPETGQSFYRVALVLEPGSVPAGIDLRPGMPVEAYITTGERSLASWLVAPLARPLARAMRED